MTDEQAPEPAPETRTINQLFRAGYVGFLKGSDGSAIVDPIMPENQEDWAKLKWRFDF
jgi:hypothetical protein